jgi:hypothetical protein
MFSVPSDSALATLLVVLGLASNARAADESRERVERAERAERAWSQGIRLGQDGKWAEALERFRASSKEFPTRVALLNQAVSLQHLCRVAEALQTLDQLERDYGAALLEEAQKEEREHVTRMRAELSRSSSVTFEGDLAGAQLSLDGRAQRLPSPAESVCVQPGAHTLRVTKHGYGVFERRVDLSGGQSVTIPVKLEAVARVPPRRTVFVEGNLAFVLANSFGGSAEASCDRTVTFADDTSGPGCSDRGVPWGGLAAARVGYRLVPKASADLQLGYVSMRQKMDRRLEAEDAGSRRFGGDELHDEMRFRGWFAAIGGSYQVGEAWPLVLRLSVGAIAARGQGRIRGSLTETTPEATETRPVQLDLVEDPQRFLVPFLAPEVRYGLFVGGGVTLDLGLAVWVLFAPSERRTADVFAREAVRRTQVTRAGMTTTVVTLPDERAFDTVVALLPSLGARYEF